MVDTRSPVFDRIKVDHLIKGDTRISWQMNRCFQDPEPYTFQLQVAPVAYPEEKDWVNVGEPFNNHFMAIDDERRLGGKNLRQYYRVLLSTSINNYESPPVHVNGNLSERDWILAREMIRKERLRHREFTSHDGYLLKKKREGTDKVDEHFDPLTGELINSRDPETGGTGFEGGFYPPVRLYADLATSFKHIERDGLQGRGTVRDTVLPARMSGFPELDEEDVWAAADNDQRWSIHKIENKAEMRGVPLVANVEFRLLPFSDPVYCVEIPEHQPLTRPVARALRGANLE